MGQGQLRALQGDTLMVKDKIDPFDDLSKIALPADWWSKGKGTKAQKKAVKALMEESFAMVPRRWMVLLKESNRAAPFKVIWWLLYRRWQSRGGPIQLSNVGLQELGVSRNSKWRALAAIEAAGLIRVERRTRKSPLIHFL
jgi:hypothetical protein